LTPAGRPASVQASNIVDDREVRHDGGRSRFTGEEEVEMRRTLGVAFAIGLAAAAAWASFSGTDTYIASTGRGPGAGGSQWYTTVWVYNPDTASANVQFTFLLRGQTNPASPYVYNDTVPAGDTKRYDNAVQTLFGLTNAFGAIHVVADHAVVVNSRIYSTPSGDDDSSSAGQFFAAVPASFAIANGQSTQILGLYQTAPAASSLFRYNYGWVETSGGTGSLRVTVFDPTGAELDHKDYTFGAYDVRQFSFAGEFPAISTTNARLQVAVTAGSGTIVAFGSGLANTSNDPSTFEMSFDPSLLASGLASVSHDSTLTGDGTAGSPLGLADGAVTKAKLAATGGASGQVLAINGTSLTWGNDSLSLPYAGSASSSSGTDIFVVQNNGAGRAMRAIATSDTALWAVSASGIGVDGRSSSNTGLFGSSTSGWGVDGRTSSNIGVHGYASAASGNTFGVWGESASATGYGIYGKEGNASGITDSNHRGGVWGDTTDGQGVLGTSTNSVGVSGVSSNKYGVQGVAFGGGSGGIAVAGFAEGTAAYAGYFSGDVHITGTLSKAGGSFIIDHPLDPAHKYLLHSFVESPDMMDVYNGNVTTDAGGVAVVVMPDWFEALNRDFRYQLTVIGQFAQAIVSQEMANNQFTITTDKPNVKVSWQVTGIRHDAWANAHRIPVEEVKPPAEQGKYLHPRLFGQPDDMGIDYARLQAGRAAIRPASPPTTAP
jgi:hypothetical protein